MERDGAASGGPDTMFDALVESRALWKEYCETIADLVFETDHQGRFTFLWPPNCLGWSADELIGRPTDTILVQSPVGHGKLFDPFRARVPIRLSHAAVSRPGGETAIMAVSARPTGKGGTRGVAIDVTSADETVREASAAIRIRRTVDRILAAAADELAPACFLRTALDGALGALGADGAALFRDGRTEDGIEAVDTLQSVGTDWEEVSALDGIVRTAEAWPAPPPGDGVETATGAALLVRDGRAVLRSVVGARLGEPCVLVIWRRERGAPWSAEDRAVAASLAASLRHVVEVDNLQHEILRAGRTDLLTTLLVRPAFLLDVGRRFGRLDREILSGTMLSIDLDDFRAVNERAGFEGGDRELRHLGAVLRDAVRPTDLVARVGGDEFAVWLDGADVFAAAERADALCRHPVFERAAGHAGCAGWSIGLATRAPGSDESAENLLRRAAAAVLEAKANGKKRWSASREEIGT